MRATTLLMLSLAALPVAAGNVYKWTDANGQVHYSQTPAPHGASNVQSSQTLQPGVSLQAPAAAKPATGPKEDKLPETAAAAPESKADKAKRCTQSKERIAFLEEKTARRLMIAQPDGSESRMTEEQFAESLAKAREAGKGC